MNELLTPAARRIVRDLEAEAKVWHERATTDDDENPFVRARAEARRDLLDSLAQRLRRDLRDVEDQAISVELAEQTRMDALLDSVA